MSKNKDEAYRETESLAREERAQTVADEGVAPESVPDEAHTLTEDLSVETLQAELEQARLEAADHKDKFIRARAEVDNMRRRAELDVANAHKFGIEKFAGEVLTVRDSLELARAVDLSAGDEQALSKMHEGLDLTLKQLDAVFDKFGLTVLDPQGEKFDPERHQAMSMVESDEVQPNHILTVVQKGCLLNERLLRPAMVIIAKAPAGKTA